jgi:hypothetical protein
MMTWVRTPLEVRCGYCGHEIAIGAPVLSVTILGVSRARVRCVACVGPAPTDLPPLMTRQVPIMPMLHVASGLGMLPLDFKQCGAREPGEEG